MRGVGNERTSDLAEFMQARRVELGLSVVTAAKAAGLSDNKWRELESGSSRHREETLLKVARGLQVPASVVLELAGRAIPRSDVLERIRANQRSGGLRENGNPAALSGKIARLSPEDRAKVEAMVDEMLGTDT
jgi:transcriptional regulator with XRE-family HTH domain